MRWVALLLVAACDQLPPDVQDAGALRVGTHIGLAPMEPYVNSTMTRNMVELVYGDALSTYVESMAVGGRTVRFRVRRDCQLSAPDLAAAFSHPELLSASAEGGEVVAHFKSEDAAKYLTLDDHLLALGKYRVADYSPQKMVLARRVPDEDGPSLIEVVAVDNANEEWRRLLAGHFDLLPSVLPGSVRHLEQVPGLRIVKFESPQMASLWFRMNGGPTANVNVRRGVASAIRRRPLAANVSGLADAAADTGREDLSAASEALLAAGYSASKPLRLHLLVHDAQADLLRAALVLQQQLATVGVSVDILAVPIDEFIRRLMTKDFDLLLFTGNLTRRSWINLRRNDLGNFTGYDSDEFEAAAAADDEVRARAVLERDLPLTPLFRLSEAAVVRRGLCGVKPRVASDYRWLADVRPCRPGEEEQ